MLTEHQLTVLKALIDAVIPPDDYPGGWDAGVGDYLLHQFEHDLSSFLPIYQQGLLALDAESQATTGQPFAALPPDAQESLLTNIEQGHVQTAWTIDPAAFFTAVCHHCAEGFYSNPGNGGNRDKIAWHMIGFEVTG